MKPAYKLFQASFKFFELLSVYHAFLGNWRMKWCRIQVPGSSCLETWVLYFSNKRIDLLLKLFSRITLFILDPHQGKGVPSFLLSSDQAYVELRVGVKRHACFAYVAKSKTRSKKKQVMQSDQECASLRYFILGGWCMNSFSWTISLLYFSSFILLFFYMLF